MSKSAAGPNIHYSFTYLHYLTFCIIIKLYITNNENKNAQTTSKTTRIMYKLGISFSASTLLLAGWHEGHLAYRKPADEIRKKFYHQLE